MVHFVALISMNDRQDLLIVLGLYIKITLLIVLGQLGSVDCKDYHIFKSIIFH